MEQIAAFVMARLKEPSSWLGIAAFCASIGTALGSAGDIQAGLIVGAVGAGFGGVGAFITREGHGS
jgi:hypothetical protein